MIKKNQIPMPKLKIALKSTDKKGNIVDEVPLRDGHTWVRNGYNLMYLWFCMGDQTAGGYGAGYMGLKDVGGTIRYANTTPFAYSGYGIFNGPAADDDKGIVVGTSSTAYTGEEYKLGSQITHGTGTNQMTYNLATNSFDWDEPSLTWSRTWTRLFDNNSDATIGVNEVGIYSYICIGLTPYRYFCIARDVLDSTVNVLDAGQLSVEYVVEIVYPE